MFPGLRLGEILLLVRLLGLVLLKLLEEGLHVRLHAGKLLLLRGELGGQPMFVRASFLTFWLMFGKL